MTGEAPCIDDDGRNNKEEEAGGSRAVGLEPLELLALEVRQKQRAGQDAWAIAGNETQTVIINMARITVKSTMQSAACCPRPHARMLMML